MKRILMCVNHDIVIFNFRKELVKKLIAEGYEVHVSCPSGERLKPLEKMGAVIHPTNLKRKSLNPFSDFTLYKSYRLLIKTIQPHFVLTYTIKPNIYASLAAKRHHVPYMPNITGLGRVFEKKGFLQWITKNLYQVAFKDARVIFVQNESHRKLISSLLPKSFIHQLPGSGVNIDDFKPLPYPKEDNLSFAFIARVMKAKGIEEFLMAAKNIKKTDPQTTFHVAGFLDGNYKDVIESYHQQGLIYYHGLVDDITPILKVSHAVILPSYHEGLSNVLLEAAACGRPVIASNIPGCKETFVDNVSGFSIEPKNSESLYQAFMRFMKLSHSEREAMGKAGREHVTRYFNRELVVKAYLNAIENIERDTI